ncbi:MAG: hypothetical protein JXX14_00925 [Deltaproteobacteria bacterium]|nr:hypothetical protein [Deltaproteobacteria bacterium]
MKKITKDVSAITAADQNQTGLRKSLGKCSKGLSTVEYIIILMLIAIAGIGLWRQFGATVIAKVTAADGEVSGL